MAISTIDALYHSGSEKLTTTSTGIDVTGTVTSDGLTSNGDILLEDNTPFINISNTGENVGGIKMYDSGGASTQYFHLTYDSGASNTVGFDTGASGEYTFSVNTAEKMRIDSSGLVAIGTAAAHDSNAILTLSKSAIAASVLKSTTNAVTFANVVNGTTSVAYSGTATNHPYYFMTNGTERMRIDSSGNVLVGTTTARSGSKIVVDGGAADTFIHLDSDSFNGTYESGLRFSANTFSSTNYYQGEISFKGDNNYSGSLTFSTAAGGTTNAPTERMRITSNGNFLVGTTYNNFNSRQTISFSGSNGSTNELGLSIWTGGGSGAMYAQFVNNQGSRSGSITQNGGSAVSYNTSSDYRLKEDWTPMTGASARVQALNPINFAWKADGSRVDGFLAHELAEVTPEAVTGTKDAMRDEEYAVTPAVLDDDGNVTTEAVMGTRSVPDYQGIDQSKLVPLLTAALQEALTEIASLKTRVQALEA